MRTYQDVAAYFDVTLCASPATPGCHATPAEHQRGKATGQVIHWTPRRMNVRGLRSFLKTLAETRILRFNSLNKAMQIHASATWANAAASQLHVRFPRAYSNADRAKVRWYESQGQAITAIAHRWAHRKEEIV